MQAVHAIQVYRDAAGGLLYEKTLDYLRDRRLFQGMVVRNLAEAIATSDLMRLASPDGEQISVPALSAFLTPMRHFALRAPVFEVTPSLNELLQETDIGEKIPAFYFTLPFPAIYLHFPAPLQEIRVVAPNVAEETTQPLEGVYVTELQANEGMTEIRSLASDERLEDYRVFEITFIGKPKHNPLTCGYTFIRFLIPKNLQERSMLEVLTSQMSQYFQQGLAQVSNLERDCLEKGLTHLSKILLYLNSNEVQRTEFHEREDLMQRLYRVRAGKRKKLKKRLNRVYDRIILGPSAPTKHQTLEQTSSARKVKAHWRRGHFRRQPYGEGSLERKIIWVAPALIGTLQDAVAAKPYKIK